MASAAEQTLAILRQLQRLLDEGDFSSTYKFALLQALADLSVEHVPIASGALTVTVEQVAEKFIEYYWRQAIPYCGDANQTANEVLRQNNGKQIAVINLIERERTSHDGSLTAFRANQGAWRRALNKVAQIVREMPIDHLQNVGGEPDEFLFHVSEVQHGRLRLLPGVPDALRSFYPMVSQLVRAGWVAKLRGIGRNQSLVGSAADLHEFLFGSNRQTLELCRSIVQEWQSSRCFYCGKEKSKGAADHFIPWSRYPVDLGHNFVYACEPCNGSKRDFLAYFDHLAHWREQNVVQSQALTRAFVEAGVVHDVNRSEFVAQWAYEQAELAGALGWVAKGSFARIDAGWRQALRPVREVAEPRASFSS